MARKTEVLNRSSCFLIGVEFFALLFGQREGFVEVLNGNHIECVDEGTSDLLQLKCLELERAIG
jgi:hypothetical protein